MILFLCFSGISLGRYCRKGFAKSGEPGEHRKERMAIKGRLSVEGGFCTLY